MFNQQKLLTDLICECGQNHLEIFSKWAIQYYFCIIQVVLFWQSLGKL